MVNKRINIEFATRQDALPIAEMSRDHIETGLGWKWGRERVMRALRNPETVVIKAMVMSEFAGFAIMRCGWQEAHLDLLAVMPHHRRNGVGMALLSWLEESTLTAGIPVIRLELRETNQDALKFYKQHGYKEVWHIKGYYCGRETAIVLARDLWCANAPIGKIIL
ncbi:MAG: GNAT family N-acetyltransferase [Gammaproteobacteria bacterium]